MHACALLVVAAMLCMPQGASAQYERPGSTDAQFLKIGVSARAAGMGEAYIASVTGAESAHYNAANLGYMEGTDLVFNHTRWFAGISHDFFSVAHQFGLGALAVSVTALSTNEMAVRTPLQPEGTGETFYATNLRAGLTYARRLTDRVSLGGTVNFISMGLYDDYSQRAIAVDVAASYVSDFQGFRFGMKIANLGSEVTYINESYPLPINFTFGLAMDAVNAADHRVIVSGSAQKPNDGKPLGNVGAEYGFRGLFFLRGGYQINYGTASYTFGTGLNLDIRSNEFRFDYGYSAFGDLGVAHRFAIGLHL